MRIFLFLLTVICLSLSSTLYAQTVNDPLRKPQVWEQLLNSPADEGLWYEYIGKTYEQMNTREKDQMNEWRGELLLLNAQRNSAQRKAEAAKEAKLKRVAEAEKLKNPYKDKSPEQVKALLIAESDIMEEPQDITELKDNLFVNFAILEDKYEVEFKRLGGTYKRYHTHYPNEEYPHVKWCEEQEAKLKQLKEAKVRELRLNN